MVDAEYKQAWDQYESDLLNAELGDMTYLKKPARIAILNRVSREMYMQEDDTVKEAMRVKAEEYHRSALEKYGPIADMVDDAERQKRVNRWVLYDVCMIMNDISGDRNIELLPRTLQAVVDRVHAETGHCIFIMWGGPDPQKEGAVRTHR